MRRKILGAGVCSLCVIAGALCVSGASATGFCWEVPECVRVSPNGALPVAGIVRDFACDPVANQAVRLVFSAQCANLRLCPDVDAPPAFVITSTTDDMGAFLFEPEVGGCCSTVGALEIRADPGDVTIAVYDEIGSPDSGGDGSTVADLRVNLPDFSRFSSAFLSESTCFDYSVLQPTAGFHCDGVANIVDFAIFAQSFLAVCE